MVYPRLPTHYMCIIGYKRSSVKNLAWTHSLLSMMKNYLSNILVELNGPKERGILSKRHRSNCHLEKVVVPIPLLTPDCNTITRIAIRTDKFLIFEKVCLTLVPTWTSADRTSMIQDLSVVYKWPNHDQRLISGGRLDTLEYTTSSLSSTLLALYNLNHTVLTRENTIWLWEFRI